MINQGFKAELELFNKDSVDNTIRWEQRMTVKFYFLYTKTVKELNMVTLFHKVMLPVAIAIYL